ncbi:alpha/beta hydrolase [Rhodococcus sp. ARC_M6]|uniref:alpha/beta hydrolase n=1 Tax=Rhodococcus sp. ARC_M6 TaxID=2928852 RepID=UPI001FB2C919|nr:alpha/beta fold hydrolase [Rhodococcus sp. ARC_M6]MCJ0907238.1 alpha/beta hydrolase [Rhodococcus sp. ARC_M6]
MSTTAKPTVLFIHGLWMHPSTWERWAQAFNELGYATMAPGWPGDASTVGESREHPEDIADHGIDEITDHYARVIADLDAPPIVVGHSFGGLIAQKLLGQKLASAAVAIDPAQAKGVLKLPLVQLGSVLPVLSNPTNYRKAYSHTKKSFHKSFASAITKDESDALYERYVIPAPGRPLFEAALANFSPHSPAKVDFNADRGPLLMIGGGKDRTVPKASSDSSFKMYHNAPTVNEYKIFDDRGHSLTIDHGWREIANYSLAWLDRQGLSPTNGHSTQNGGGSSP